MKTVVEIDSPEVERDYFPCIFTNKNTSIIILAEEKTSDRTFSGMIIHSDSNNKKASLGTYSTSWTYAQFKRIPLGSKLSLDITQEK